MSNNSNWSLTNHFSVLDSTVELCTCMHEYTVLQGLLLHMYTKTFLTMLRYCMLVYKLLKCCLAHRSRINFVSMTQAHIIIDMLAVQ